MTVVVFDIGGVLAPEADRIQRLVSFLSLSGVAVWPEALSQAYWHHRDAYDLAQSDQDYWTAVLNAAGVKDLSGVDFQGLGALDGGRNAAITPESMALLQWLVLRGVRLALLSNAPLSMVKAVRESTWGQLFSVKIFSSEVGLAKPNVAIYQAADQAIQEHFSSDVAPSAASAPGASSNLATRASSPAEPTGALAAPAATLPGPIYFFDDRAVNLPSAEAVGWKAHLFVSTEQCRQILEEELV